MRLDPNKQPFNYLQSLEAIRDQSNVVMAKAGENQLNHFDVDMDKFKDTVKAVVQVIERDFEDKYDTIPPHGRWQHFEVGGVARVEEMIKSWLASNVDAKERTRRLFDLFLVSVLLDAGAGVSWRYKSQDNAYYSRSEGLAVASIEMFRKGAFSSDATLPEQVDAARLLAITDEDMKQDLQVNVPGNQMDGLEGRSALMNRLGLALKANESIFGTETSRPGNMIDYLCLHCIKGPKSASMSETIDVSDLWDTLMVGLAPIWPPSRTKLQGKSLGDAWPCKALPSSPEWASIIPFHKLTQWLCYSLMPPIKRELGVDFTNSELLTGLSEYRNGGLLVDTGLLTLRQADTERGIKAFHEHCDAENIEPVEVVPAFEPHDDVIVEWRAVIIGFLDKIHASVNEELKLKLSLAQILEAGTWKGGRELAAIARPKTKGPPIMIISDGTVF